MSSSYYRCKWCLEGELEHNSRSCDKLISRLVQSLEPKWHVSSWDIVAQVTKEENETLVDYVRGSKGSSVLNALW